MLFGCWPLTTGLRLASTHLLDGLVTQFLGVDTVCGTQLPSDVKLVSVDVNGEDTLGLWRGERKREVVSNMVNMGLAMIGKANSAKLLRLCNVIAM